MMKTSPLARPIAALAVSLFLCPAAWAVHGNVPGVTAVDPASTQWSDAPPAVPKGAKISVLSGDPGKPGPFVMRLSVPARYRVPAHWHTNAENVTVISGTMHLGLGEKFDMKALHAYRPGSYVSLPGKLPHFANFNSPTVVQIQGDGPFDLVYVNEADDPQKKTMK